MQFLEIAILAPNPPPALQGAVLLDTAFQPRTVWQFDALLVLLNGHWPPRGLLSGHWPPEPAALVAAGSSPRPPVHPTSRFSGWGDGCGGGREGALQTSEHSASGVGCGGGREGALQTSEHSASGVGSQGLGCAGSGESFTGSGDGCAGSGEGTVLMPEHSESSFRHGCTHSCHDGLPAAHRSVSMPVLADGGREAAAGASTRRRGASPPHTRRSEGCASDGCQGTSHERRRKQTCVQCVCLLPALYS